MHVIQMHVTKRQSDFSNENRAFPAITFGNANFNSHHCFLGRINTLQLFLTALPPTRPEISADVWNSRANWLHVYLAPSL